MSGTDDRVEQALAAHIEHLEVGGDAPDTSHLDPAELEKLQELIGLLDATEGIAFGRGLAEVGAGKIASTEQGALLLAEIREALPAGARITSDPAPASMEIEGMDVVEGFIVGTFGGRVRVWSLAREGALEASDGWLRDLELVFRLYPDTVAVTLVTPDHSCLLVQPEDCAPTIEVPRGALVGRRYRRPILAVGEALSVFLRELIPYWEPMEDISGQPSSRIDVEPIATERAGKAIDDQVAAGGRARKTNPKRKALTELGDTESGALAKLLLDVHEGRANKDDVEEAMRKLATKR